MIYIAIGILIVYLILIMPKMINRRDFTPFLNRHYTHRGLHDNIYPENSITAFKLSVDKGYGIEFDVQLSKDNIPIVMHDFNLQRMCGIEKLVNELTLLELKELKLYNSLEGIPTLEEVLKLVDGKVPLIVELKLPNNDTKICEIVAAILDNYNGIYSVESFNPLAIIWYKKNRPYVIRGQLSTNFLKSGKNNFLLNFILQNLMFNFYAKPDFIAFNHEFKNMLSYKINHFLYRIPTVAYTIKTRDDLEKNRNYFDLFIFENFIP